MKKILEYLEKEREEEKKKIIEEFEQKKKEIEEFWQEKIDSLNDHFQKKFEQKKKEFLEKEAQMKKQEMLLEIEREKSLLKEEFKKEVKKIIQNLSLEEKEKILRKIFEILKASLLSRALGTFKIKGDFFHLVKEFFPEARVEKGDIDFGFFYFDEALEIELNEDNLLEQFLQKYKLF